MGAGGFAATSTTSSLPPIPGPWWQETSTAACKMDLAVANGTNVAILLGNGNGTFGVAKQYRRRLDRQLFGRGRLQPGQKSLTWPWPPTTTLASCWADRVRAASRTPPVWCPAPIHLMSLLRISMATKSPDLRCRRSTASPPTTSAFCSATAMALLEIPPTSPPGALWPLRVVLGGRLHRRRPARSGRSPMAVSPRSRISGRCGRHRWLVARQWKRRVCQQSERFLRRRRSAFCRGGRFQRRRQARPRRGQLPHDYVTISAGRTRAASPAPLTIRSARMPLPSPVAISMETAASTWQAPTMPAVPFPCCSETVRAAFRAPPIPRSATLFLIHWPPATSCNGDGKLDLKRLSTIMPRPSMQH